MQENELNRLFEALKGSRNGEASESQVQNAVSGLTPQQRASLNEILSSPEKMKAFFQSDTAKEMMKKLGKKGS